MTPTKHSDLYLQIIADLGQNLTHKNTLNDILNNALALAQQKLGYEYLNLFLLNATRQTLTLQAAAWRSLQAKPEDFISLRADQGLAGQVVVTGESILVNDVSSQPAFWPHPALPQVKSQLAVPIHTGQNLIGVLDVESNEPNAFAPEDCQVLQALATHIGLIIENARLRKLQQHYLREQTLIYESMVALGVEPEVETMLKFMSQKMTEAANAGACVISRIDEKANTVTALAEYIILQPDHPTQTWRKLKTPLPLSKDPICQQVLIASRSTTSQAHLQRATKPFIWQLPADSSQPAPRWHTVLALPLETQKEVIGQIEIYDKRPDRTFSPEEVKLCRILATQTALAMEQAHLFDEMVERLAEVSMLYTMAEKISSSLDQEDVLNTIVTSLRQVIGCRACCIFLLDDTGRHLEIKAADGLKPHWQKMAKLQVGEGVAGLAVAEGRTVYLPDTHQDPDFIFFDKEVRSLMVVPLLAHGKIIGAINVDDSQPNAFDYAQERLLTIAAAQAGITIENARLFTKISAEQQQMQAIIQNMADGVLLIDSHGLIITCNSTLAMMLGLSPGQIIHQDVNAPDLPPNLASITATTTQRARTGVLVRELKIESPRPRTLQIFSTVMFDNHKNPVGEIRLVHDVTKERELEQLKDEFFSMISHELRTPLFSIHGFAQLMLEEDSLDRATQKEFLGTIQRQALQLSEMVNNLLDLSKFDAGKMEFEKKPIAFPDLIQQAIAKLQGFAHQQEVKLIPPPFSPIPTFYGDNQRLEQVLTNLIGNAIKFSQAGGEIVVTTSVVNNNLLVQVKDHGIGIPAEALDQVFSRYYQANNKSQHTTKGSGLGLYISKKIIEGHGGRIWVESTVGQGSIFSFMLPLPH